MSARHLTTVVALLGSALAAGGCSVYDPALVGTVDAGPPQRDAGPPRDAGPCDPHRPPPRPTTADSPDGPLLYFAAKDLVIDQGSERWRMIGYDLDGLCSLPPEPIVECAPPRRTASMETDGDNGLDNVFGHTLAPLLLAADPLIESDAQHNQLQGLGVVLIDLRGWNGMDDDPRVDVVLAQSVFGTPGDPDAGVPMPMLPDGGRISFDDGGVPTYPAWDGTDYWWARDDAFLDANPDVPLVRDNNAYVAGRTLVFRLPDRTPITFSGDTRGVAVRLTDTTMTGRISADLTRLDDVTVSGRWAVLDILDIIENAGVCRGTAQYNIISNLLMTSADVRSAAGTGEPGIAPTVQCDAISFATRLNGFRAHFGGVARSFGLPDSCALMDGGVVGMDAGVPSVDAGGAADAGTDAGARDAGTDAGARDAGTDAGVRDAG